MTYDPSASPAVVPSEDRNWAMGAHLSAFVAAYIALGFLGPLIVLLVRGDRSPFVRRHAVEALNFNLTVLIYVVICVILALVLIGFVLLIALGILYVVAVIIGAVRASSGEEYRYPLTIRFVK
ncbi:MAG TPA: DUF4870 domain-containing protein [Jiangellaceae bacterium]|nr:DUF4870 domain-containing protein [Jiangellaceae bacterium]